MTIYNPTQCKIQVEFDFTCGDYHGFELNCREYSEAQYLLWAISRLLMVKENKDE